MGLGDVKADGHVVTPDSRVLMVLFSAFCSASAAVANESAYKGQFGTATVGINRLNTMLYTMTSTIVMVALAWQSGGSFAEAFHGFDRSAAALVTAQAFLGLC